MTSRPLTPLNRKGGSVSVLLLLVFVTGTAFSYNALYSIESRSTPSSQEEVLYLPSGQGLDILSFGYRNLLSDLLWFRTVSYFGKHLQSDRNYRWLSHMCHLVTDLDPRARYVFDFCGTMLAWEAELPEESIRILTKAIASEPEWWRYHYLRGFTRFYFLGDEEGAKSDFVTGSRQPEAPAFLARLAASKMSKDDPAAAVQFLREMLRNAQDTNERTVLENKLREAQDKLNISQINRAAEIFRQRIGRDLERLDELVTEGIVRGGEGVDPFRDPYGRRYHWDREKGVVGFSHRSE